MSHLPQFPLKANTCITFNKPNSTDPVYITRNNEPLCAFIGDEDFPKPTAWNRTFSCRIHINNLSVCFSDTMVTDADAFYFIIGNVQENTTLEVECKFWKYLHLFYFSATKSNSLKNHHVDVLTLLLL